MPGKMIIGHYEECTGEDLFTNLDTRDTDLFTEDSRTSYVFEVRNDGSGVLVTAYGLCTDIYLEQVKLRIDKMPHGMNKCCPCQVDAVSAARPSAVDLSTALGDDDLAKCWGLTPHNNQGVIAVPGHYRLMAVDSGGVGCATVCAKLLTQEAMVNVPRSLIFGN